MTVTPPLSTLIIIGDSSELLRGDFDKFDEHVCENRVEKSEAMIMRNRLFFNVNEKFTSHLRSRILKEVFEEFKWWIVFASGNLCRGGPHFIWNVNARALDSSLRSRPAMVFLKGSRFLGNNKRTSERARNKISPKSKEPNPIAKWVTGGPISASPSLPSPINEINFSPARLASRKSSRHLRRNAHRPEEPSCCSSKMLCAFSKSTLITNTAERRAAEKQLRAKCISTLINSVFYRSRTQIYPVANIVKLTSCDCANFLFSSLLFFSFNANAYRISIFSSRDTKVPRRVCARREPADKLNMLIERRCNKRLVIGRVAYRFNAPERRETDSQLGGDGDRALKSSMQNVTIYAWSNARATGRFSRAAHHNYNKHF